MAYCSLILILNLFVNSNVCVKLIKWPLQTFLELKKSKQVYLLFQINLKLSGKKMQPVNQKYIEVIEKATIARITGESGTGKTSFVGWMAASSWKRSIMLSSE